MKIILYPFIFLFLAFSFILGASFFVLHNKAIDFSVLEHYDPGNPTILLDDEGNEWARFQLYKREPVSIEKIPKHLINAFIAAEDWAFFTHCGISFKGIIRSIVKNLYYRRRIQGGSTITQQLVRLLFFNSKKTISRKIKEQIYSILVERQFSKEQILETYLNHICFGRGIYGVQAACQRFWGKNVSDISIEEAATIAGLIQSPEHYFPLAYPTAAKKRRNIVLGQMKKRKFITDDAYKQLTQLPIVTKQKTLNRIAPHLQEHIRIFLEKLVGKHTLYTGGLVIQTTLNKNIQQKATQSFNQQYEIIKKNISSAIDGSLISIDTATGEIKALIGGYDFNKSQYNRAFQSKRQLGSVFKPIVYAAAMQSGTSFDKTEVDEPMEIIVNKKSWKPNNAYQKFDGQMSLAWALSVSNNIVAIKTLLNIGIKKVIKLAQKFHLNCHFNPYPSLALGCIDVSLKNAAGMFNTFANNGIYVEPHCIKWVKNKWGTKLWKAKTNKERILDPKISGQVVKVLQLGLKRIKRLIPQKWVKSQAISKTGTTNDSRICWFVGSTPTLTTAVYIGRDDNQPMGKNIYPLRTAFPIWIGLYRELEFDKKKFTFDPSLQKICINRRTGEVTQGDDPEAISILV